MKRLSPEKIGMDELLEIKRSSRQTYVLLPGILVKTFDLEPGDIIKVRIKEVIRSEKEEGNIDEPN